jgi:hypothetical protein
MPIVPPIVFFISCRNRYIRLHNLNYTLKNCNRSNHIQKNYDLRSLKNYIRKTRMVSMKYLLRIRLLRLLDPLRYAS